MVVKNIHDKILELLRYNRNPTYAYGVIDAFSTLGYITNDEVILYIRKEYEKLVIV